MTETVTSRAALKALNTTTVTTAMLVEGGRTGYFVWTAGNFTSLISADTQEGIYIKANAIAATTGAWVRQREELVLNVLWFGASTALANNATAFQAAATLFAVTRIIVPAGTFNFTATVTFNPTHIIWQGQGRFVTQLVWSGSLNGFNAGTTTPMESMEVYDIGFKSSGTSTTSTAINAVFSHQLKGQGNFQRLYFSGVSGSAQWFGVGIKTTNCMLPTFRDIIGMGATGANLVDVARADALISCTATTDAVIMIFDNIYSLNFGSMIKLRASSSPSMEGIFISRCNSVFSNTGIDIVFSSGSYKPPQMFVTDSQFECFYREIDIAGASEVTITNSLFLHANFNNIGTDCIMLRDCVSARVSGNSIVTRPTNTTVNGISVHNTAHAEVHDNKFEGPGPHIVFSGTSNNCVERNNKHQGSGPPFIDASSFASTNKGGKLIAATGYQWNGDVLEQWGTFATTTNASGEIGVNFPIRFPNAAFSVVAVNGDAAAGTDLFGVRNLTVANFLARFTGAASVPRRVNWFARGN